jgi:hypothetical protein
MRLIVVKLIGPAHRANMGITTVTVVLAQAMLAYGCLGALSSFGEEGV